MKKLLFALSMVSVMCFSLVHASCWDRTSCCNQKDLTHTIPQIEVCHPDFDKVPDVAQYGEGIGAQVIGMTKGISLSEAYTIASQNEAITYFFYMKGGRMVIGSQENGYYSFNHGDTVFFSGTPCWRSAKGFADGYMKINQ